MARECSQLGILPVRGGNLGSTENRRCIFAVSTKSTARRVIVAAEVIAAPKSEVIEPIIDSEQTTCCVVGGGPGGMMLSLLLARKGVPVTLLEAHKDFDRDFRGDTIHPSILEILDELGLADRALQIPHGKLYSLQLRTPNG